MQLNALIDGNLRTAFKLLGDKTVPVTFNLRSVGAFDFSTATYAVGTDITTQVVVDAVIIDDNKKSLKSGKDSEKRNIAESEIMVKKQDLGELEQYDTVTINSVVWGIGVPIKNDGHIIILKLHREK